MRSSTGSRVLMLLENNPYPQDGRVRREATCLAAAGYQVSVISPGQAGQPWHERIGDIRVYRFPAPPDGDGLLGYLWEYGYAMMATLLLSLLVFFRDGFDVLHAHNPPDTFVFIAAIYKLFGKRFIFDHHDLSPEMYHARFDGQGSRLVYLVLLCLEKLSFRLADHVIATNESYKKIALERGRVPEERITVVRNGPESGRVRLVPPDANLRRLNKTIIGYVGEMGFQDGIDYLLRALHHLLYDLGRTDFFCVLIGHGDAWDTLNDLAIALSLEKVVWFTGHVTDAELIRYLSSADICVDPDPSNPFTDRSTMIKMMEYMALGKPIVAFDLPEHRVTAQVAAVYAKPNNELDFAQKIALLMDNPIRRQYASRYGKQRVETSLAWPRQATNLLAAYAALGLFGTRSELEVQGRDEDHLPSPLKEPADYWPRR
ncbi:MAG: glycosyltransferase family 4 protein [Anaerolineae bacterium]|nr:glycosyltransferase family 4 protein [Anaerolineae bacterium]